jgi:two-component system NtrC family sensor kinase
MRGGIGLLIDVLSRFKVTFFLKLMIASSIVAVVGLLIFSGSVFSFGFSLAVHTLLAVALFWFMVKIVWPIRAGLDKIVLFVEKHKVSSDEEVSHRSEIVMGSYRGVLDNVVNLMENQYEDLISHSRQLENFSQVLEKQNRKINESRQRYRRTLDALENGLFLVDDNYVIQSINRSEAAYYQAQPKELVGKKCYQIFRQRTTPCSDCMPRECMADGQSRSRLRVERRRFGREYVNIYCYPIFHEGEESHEVVIYIQDTSPLVMMEEQVIRTEKMASIGQMAAGIAHDLNNYLAAIYGVVQLLQMRFEAAPAGCEKDLKLLGRLREQVEALNLMAGNLMVFSHPERKELFPLSLNQVIDDALSFSRYELEREQVGVNKKFAESLPSGRMEKGQIQQVVLNLMLNAAQAIRERKNKLEDGFIGQVTVTTGLEDEKHIFFSVSDNGAGITSECQEHLFDPFFSTKEVKVEGGATGLGLFTAQTIVEQHQGSISFSSEIGKGSSFKVVLPLRQDDDFCIS